MKECEKGFIQGYACACATIINTHGEDTVCYDVLSCNTWKPDELRSAGVDEDDIKTLMPVIKEISRKSNIPI